MKTWEIMQHSSKEFRRKSDGLIIAIMEDGTLNWASGCKSININDEWEEVKEPVSFIEVLEKVKSKDNILLTVENEEYEEKIEHQPLDVILARLANAHFDTSMASILLNGKWYIE